MDQRLKLQKMLEELLGSSNVYFQPPESIQLKYPCIIYQWNTGDASFADNHPYIFTPRYQLMVIDRNPDSAIPHKIARLPKCTMDRTFTTDNLNHWVFNLYF